MLLKGLIRTLTGLSLLVLIGCGREDPDNRLTEIALRQGRQEREVSRMAGQMDGIRDTLSRVRAVAWSRARKQPVGFEESPEYEQLSTALTDIQDKLSAAETGFAEAKAELERETRRNPHNRWKAMRKPQEFTERLDALLENFSQKIEDPVRKQQFQADLKKWKWINNLSLKEFRFWMISDLRQELPNAKDERVREWLRRWLEVAESPSLSTEDRLRSWRSVTNERQLRDIVKAYAIPGEVLADAGVPDPREGRPRFE